MLVTLWQYLNFCPVSHFGTPQWLLDRQKNLPTCHCHYCCRILFCKIYQRPRLAGNLILLDTQKSSWTPLTFHNTQLKSLLHLQKKRDSKRPFLLKYIIYLRLIVGVRISFLYCHIVLTYDRSPVPNFL